MRTVLLLALFLLVGLLSLWSYVESRRVHRPLPAAPEPPADKVEREKPVVLLPEPEISIDIGDWERHETLGGIFRVPVPPGWVAHDQRDRYEPARLSTGFMVAASFEDTRSGVFFFPFLPLLSAGSSEVRALLDAYRGRAPRHIGLILYDHPDLGPVLRRQRWPFLTVQEPVKVFDAFENPWVGTLFWQKYGIPKPSGFQLSGPRDLKQGLAVARLSFGLGPEMERLRQVEGLAFLGTARPAPGHGGWGLLLVFLQAPEGKWADVAPTLQAILLGLEYDPEAHLEQVGPERASEVTLYRGTVPRLGRFDLPGLLDDRRR